MTFTGRLTADPELRRAGETPVTTLRVACNTRRWDTERGEHVDKPNFVNVTVFGPQAKECCRRLRRASPVGVDGEFDWQEWVEADGRKRQEVGFLARYVKFLGAPDGGGGESHERAAPDPPREPQARPQQPLRDRAAAPPPQATVEADAETTTEAGVGSVGSEDDMPF